MPEFGPPFLRVAVDQATRLIPYSGCWSSLRPMSWPISPAPTITAFCRYASVRLDTERAAVRPIVTNAIPKIQKRRTSVISPLEYPVNRAKGSAPTLTSRNTRARSSSVV